MSNFILVVAVLFAWDFIGKLVMLARNDKTPASQGARACDLLIAVLMLIWAIQLLTGAKT